MKISREEKWKKKFVILPRICSMCKGYYCLEYMYQYKRPRPFIGAWWVDYYCKGCIE